MNKTKINLKVCIFGLRLIIKINTDYLAISINIFVANKN